MPNQGEQTFKLHKMDDLTAYDLVAELKDFLKIPDQISIRLVHGFQYTIDQLPKGSVGPGKYQFSQIHVNGALPEIGSGVRGGVAFYRHIPNQPDILDSSFDYVTLQFGNDNGQWLSHIDKLLRCIEIVTSKDVTVVPDTTDQTEAFRALVLSQDAAHKRMLDDLHKSLTDMAERRAKLEADAERIEKDRKHAHDAAQRDLEDQKAALERQSYMATRRKLGQSIHKVMTDQNKDGLRHASRRWALSYFVATVYVMLGFAGAFGTYLTFMALNDVMASEQLYNATAAVVANTPSGQGQGTIGVPVEGATLSTFTWFLIVKLVISSVITVFGFVSAATWLRRYLDNETRLSEEKIAFLADVERASWVIEAIHEVKHEAQSELPKEWVDAVTRNLFAPRMTAADLDDGAQALRALIGLAGSAKVGPQGLEMEFNKKGTKALGDAGE